MSLSTQVLSILSFYHLAKLPDIAAVCYPGILQGVASTAYRILRRAIDSGKYVRAEVIVAHRPREQVSLFLLECNSSTEACAVDIFPGLLCTYFCRQSDMVGEGTAHILLYC